MFHEARSEAKPGDVVGVCVRGQPTAPFYAYPNGALLPTRSAPRQATRSHQTQRTRHTRHTGAVIMPGEEYAASLVELTAMELVAQVEAVGAYAAKVRALDHASSAASM
jgi:hypothetical protein